MNTIRRILGVFVMIAGVIGLLLSLTGLIGIWMAKPVVTAAMDTTITGLTSSLDTSQKAIMVTQQALGASVKSIDALAAMLSTTAKSVEDTQPVVTQVSDMLGQQMPLTIAAATDSLKSAQEAARSLEGTIQSLDSFRTLMSKAPLVGAFIPANSKPYKPEKPLADSLGDLAGTLQNMPPKLQQISTDIDKADNNLALIKNNLDTMATGVGLISSNLEQYQSMIGQSQVSMDNLRSLLTSVQDRLDQILNIATIVLVLFFVWLLAAQVVIFSQGWELYQGTASQMESVTPETVAAGAASAD